LDTNAEKYGHVIFNGEVNDSKRSQMEFDRIQDGRFKGVFRKSFQTNVLNLYPGYKESGMVVLRSEAGCQAQRAHTDYPLTDRTRWGKENDHRVPLAAVVALMDDTSLDVWPEGIRFNETTMFTCRQIQLNAGDVLVFRGDLVHAGAFFPQLNVRVHSYLEPLEGGFERQKEKDGTEVTYYMDHRRSNILPRGSAAVMGNYY
jgi:hypothetical protein